MAYSRADTPVQGQQDDQQPPGGFPVQVAFLDPNGNARVPKTDASGNVFTVGGTGTSANQVQGTAADNTAAVGNPVQVGGIDNSGNAQALNLDTTGNNLRVGLFLGNSNTVVNGQAAGASDGVANTFSSLFSTPYTMAYAPTGTTSVWDRLRTPTIVKTVQTAANGSTALWTPTSGKKFRLMRMTVQVSANSTLAARGILTVKLLDSAADLNITADVYLGQTAIAADTNPQPVELLGGRWIDLGNGLLSAAANNVLNVNLSAALTNGAVRVICCGTEE
jgi:hypothetical protein